MTESGTDEIVIVKDKKAPMTPENIRATKEVTHRKHTLKRHGK
jgi:hypothetical protein